MFGAIFVAMKIVMETLQGIRNKPSMMGVPVVVPSYIYGDNMSVIRNTQRTDTTLKKNRIYIFYHDVHEYVTMGETLT